MTRKLITSDAFISWLRNAGVVTDLARRVVIDSRIGEAVIIYVEQYGTEGLINGLPPPELLSAELRPMPEEPKQ